ncbi:MAG: nucleotidyltransferase [Anaerolineales bacterium]|nr:nucleotidyltransferase [Anaerolineales bacterium]
MGKLNSLFDAFLSNLEPETKAVNHAVEAHTYVRGCLQTDCKLAEVITGSFLYGSYRRHTAVGDIKDVDIVILTDLDTTDPDNNPQKVLRRFKAALGECYENPETAYQRRSIRVDEPLPDRDGVELTLDIIPAVVQTTADEPLLVPDRDLKVWIPSHPRGHLKHTTTLNSEECSQGRYVPLVKMMKWWWKYQCEVKQPDVERPKPKGFWVECLTGENFDPTRKEWADHFVAVLTNISLKYFSATTVPSLADPGLPGEIIKTSMSPEEFQVFLDCVNESLALAIVARDETDDLQSSELWRQIFGDKFPLYDSEEAEETRKAASAITLSSISHARIPPWPVKLQQKAKVRLNAYVHPGVGNPSGLNSNGRILQGGLEIKFVASTGCRGEYEVHWQVVNTGEHAKNEGGLRGDFFQGRGRNRQTDPNNPLVNWEITQYTGKHWIECFIVQNGVCVGRSNRFYVNIRNSD